jgi:protein-tyrosine phosphatase
MHFVRRLLDRMRHEGRRTAALEIVRGMPGPGRVLFVCHGNLCRSPYAAARLRSLLGAPEGAQIDSAGFATPGRASPPDAVAAADTRGLRLSEHRSQVVNRTRLDAADLIVVMEPGQMSAVTARKSSQPRRVVVLGDLDTVPDAPREIADPFGRGRDVFDACYERIDRCVTELRLAMPTFPEKRKPPSGDGGFATEK